MNQSLRSTQISFACHDRSCAPPPIGTGGSKGGPGKLSPRPNDRNAPPKGKFKDLVGIDDLDYKEGFTVEVGQYGQPGHYTAAALRVERDLDRGEIDVRGTVYDGRGNRVGDFSRRFSEDSGHLVVEHSWFNLDKSAQGKGIAQALNDQAVGFYREHGISEIRVHASLQVGPYAWARQGYRIRDENYGSEADAEHARKEWSGDRIKSMRNAVKSQPGLDDDVRDETSRKLTEMLNASNKGADIQPIHVASFGEDDPRLHWHDPDFGDMWPGKAVLVNNFKGADTDKRRTWHGSYFLDS